MKRIFEIAFIAICSVGVLLPMKASRAATPTLVKGQNSSSVYYVFNEKRYAFPNERIFFSWYPNFDSVSTVLDSTLASLPLMGSVTYRPGVQMIKLTTDPKVYAVVRNSELRWIQTEAIAIQLYGTDWATKVHDLSDAFFPAYHVGDPISSSGAFSPSSETNSVTTIGQNLGVSVAAQSNFFKGNTTFGTVLSGTPLDVSKLHMWDPANYPDKSGFAYKLLAAFLMLGYTPDTTHTQDTKHLVMLKLFQKNNGFPVSNNLTLDVAKKIDSLLVTREAQLATQAQAFPLYSHMGALSPSEVSKDFIAMMYSFPILQLPDSLRLHGEQEYVDCIKVQCLGFVQPSGTAPVGYWYPAIDITKPYEFFGAYFDPQRNSTAHMIQNVATVMHTVLHEYAHSLYGSKINVTGYETIVKNIGTCDQDGAALSVNFLTRYGFLKARENCATRTDKSLSAGEDFADSFGGYVMWGKAFRAAAAKNNSISQRYQWLKTNVFQGKEFDTDFPALSNSGCYDDTTPAPTGTGQYDFPYNLPGYVSCNETYVWDGTFKTL